jgi:hypothetical protein
MFFHDSPELSSEKCLKQISRTMSAAEHFFTSQNTSAVLGLGQAASFFFISFSPYIWAASSTSAVPGPRGQAASSS